MTEYWNVKFPFTVVAVNKSQLVLCCGTQFLYHELETWMKIKIETST